MTWRLVDIVETCYDIFESKAWWFIFSAGNNQDCSRKFHHPHIKEVAGVVVVVMVVGAATGILEVQVREGTTMMAAKGVDIVHISFCFDVDLNVMVAHPFP